MVTDHSTEIGSSQVSQRRCRQRGTAEGREQGEIRSELPQTGRSEDSDGVGRTRPRPASVARKPRTTLVHRKAGRSSERIVGCSLLGFGQDRRVTRPEKLVPENRLLSTVRSSWDPEPDSEVSHSTSGAWRPEPARECGCFVYKTDRMTTIDRSRGGLLCTGIGRLCGSDYLPRHIVAAVITTCMVSRFFL